MVAGVWGGGCSGEEDWEGVVRKQGIGLTRKLKSITDSSEKMEQ